MFNDDNELEEKKSGQNIKEMQNEFREQVKIIESENDKTKPEVENKKIIPWDKIARNIVTFEGAFIASSLTKNHPDSIKEAARELCKPTDIEVNLMKDFLEAFSERYAPDLMQSKEAPLILLGLTYAGCSFSKYSSVKSLVEMNGVKK